MSRKLKKWLVRIGVALLLYAGAIISARLLPLGDMVRLGMFLVVYAIIGWDIVWKAVRNIFHGQVFDENFLMVVATVGAFVLGDYPESVAVMLFYQMGEWCQSYAVGKSRRSIAALMDIRPDHANLRQADGSLVQVPPEEVEAGRMIVVKPGERVPLDGIVREGDSSLDTSALTGEAAPRDVHPGMEIFSGTVNQTGVLTVQVTKVYGESTVARILDLVENASAKKAKTETFITRFARWYTPAVCLAALLLAVLPPLITGDTFGPWVYRALTFLVISCPCALVISIPLSFFGGIGGASKLGILVKGSSTLEALAATRVMIFDKTGTLTKGAFAVSEIVSAGADQAELLELAAYAEGYSTHPIAKALREAYGAALDFARVQKVEELAGHGMRAVIDGREVLAGNRKLMQENGIPAPKAPEAGTVVYLAAEGEYQGYILVEDVVKPEAKQALAELRKEGIRKTVMLTGDCAAVGEKVGVQLCLDEVCTGLLPDEKLVRAEALLAASDEKNRVAFVGDGVNDAPVLARVHVGIAMGALGSDAAIEAADVVIMTDEISKIPAAMRVSRRTLSIARQNIIFALGIKAVVLLLGALGFASMWMAVFADVGVSVLAILNAMRALRVKGMESPATNVGAPQNPRRDAPFANKAG